MLLESWLSAHHMVSLDTGGDWTSHGNKPKPLSATEADRRPAGVMLTMINSGENLRHWNAIQKYDDKVSCARLSSFIYKAKASPH